MPTRRLMSEGNRGSQSGISMLIFSKSPLGTNFTMNGFISMFQQSHNTPKTQNRLYQRNFTRTSVPSFQSYRMEKISNAPKFEMLWHSLVNLRKQTKWL